MAGGLRPPGTRATSARPPHRAGHGGARLRPGRLRHLQRGTAAAAGLATSVVLRSAITSAAKLLSREYATDGVTVNCVAPGSTATQRRRDLLAARAQRTGTNPAALDAADLACVPAGRAARPEEIGAVVTFLASSAASYVNGTVVTVDGGRTETI